MKLNVPVSELQMDTLTLEIWQFFDPHCLWLVCRAPRMVHCKILECQSISVRYLHTNRAFTFVSLNQTFSEVFELILEVRMSFTCILKLLYVRYAPSIPFLSLVSEFCTVHWHLLTRALYLKSLYLRSFVNSLKGRLDARPPGAYHQIANVLPCVEKMEKSISQSPANSCHSS